MVLSTVGVTGASGMLGRHVVAALENAGLAVVQYLRRPSAPPARSWDLSEWKTDDEFDALFESVHAVVHAGAAVPRAPGSLSDQGLYDANVRATFNLGRWALKRDLPLVYVSGAIVFADPNGSGIREDAPLGWTGLGGPYGLSKSLAEGTIRQLKDSGLKVAIVRPSSVYGHGLGAEKVISGFLKRAKAGDAIELTEPVADSSNLVHAADVGSAIVKILQGQSWETFNVAAPAGTSMIALAEACVAVAGRGRLAIAPGHQPPRAPIHRFDLNCDFAQTRLGWCSRVTLDAGLRAIMEERVIVV